ncbi:MAG: RiPP maturation radical SAM C-methyltransferase [Pseudomonadota bacterium]
MNPHTHRVGLVYPPFAPGGLPSLGLALLAAGLEAQGLPSRTIFWNLELASRLPGATPEERIAAYSALTHRIWFPFNEWLYAGELHGARLAQRDATTQTLLELKMRSDRTPGLSLEGLLTLRHDAGRELRELADRLADCAVVGINTTFYQNAPALALAKCIKERHPDILVGLGGANCDGEMGLAWIELFPFLDFAFSGEADHSFPRFVRRFCDGEQREGLLDTPGLFLRLADGSAHRGPPAAPLGALDGLPEPDFDDYVEARRALGFAERPLVLPLESSRGCWWGERKHCTFCGLNANGMAFRAKSQARFMAEVDSVTRRYGTRYLFMADNILSMEYLGEFAGWAAESGMELSYFWEVKANLDRRRIRRLAQAGVTAVQPGIESFSTPILRLMRKGVSAIQNVAFLKYAREYGVLPAYNILIGVPGEPVEEYGRMARDLALLVHLRPPSSAPRVEFHRFSPFHAEPAAFDLHLRPSPWYRQVHPFPEDQLARIAYLFVREEGEPRLEHVEPLIRAVDRWRAVFRDEDCSLTWWPVGDDVLIDDHRPGLPKQRVRLRDHAAVVFQALDRPRSLSTLAREAGEGEDEAAAFMAWIFGLQVLRDGDELVISFSRARFAAEPEGCIEPLVEASLLYVERAPAGATRYLALPVRRSPRPVGERWTRLGI